MTLPESPTVRRVVAGQLCSGCGLCAGVASSGIAMGEAAPGYARPQQRGPVKETTEAIIARSCPGAVVAPWPPGPDVHPVWGPMLDVLTGHATDSEIRFKGASGGAVTALALHALQSGLVDRVVHVTADPADPVGNRVVVSTSRDEIVAGAGSRYIASSPLADIESVLADGGRAAFVGKPCDVSALRQLARFDPRVAEHIPLMLAFFCAGIPSRRAVGRVVDEIGLPAAELAAFRYRGHGWPGRATAITRDGREGDMSYERSWGGFLSREVQFRCKICPDAVGGVADVAAADAWYGGETGYPTFEELDGRSLVLSRTEVGARLVQSAVAAGALSVEPLDPAEIDLMQPSQANRKHLVRGRLLALTVTLQPRPRTAGLRVERASRGAGLVAQLRNFLGTVRRILLRRR
ncbi:MAG: Coenzyme F420 hydrogenase/dehydrogenase, beta subunit C-terminal domain [Phenylobacterium sp.]